MVTSSMTFHGHFMMTFDGHFTMTFHGHFSLPYDFGVLRLVSLHPFTHLLPATRPKNPTKHPSPTNSPLTTILPHTDVHPLSPKHHYDQGLPTYHIPPSFHYHHPNYFIRSIPILPPTDVHPLSPKHHYHKGPPHTTSHLSSTAITPITLSDLFLFSRTQMSTHCHLSTTMTRAPTYLIPPSFHYHHPQLPCLIYSYFPAMQVKCDGDRPPPTTFPPNYCLFSHDPR